jgi:hypothetical protein
VSDAEDDDGFAGDEPGTIGVGMGGSCPTCRAPVDLGQEFCLECGAPIRFTPRQRQGKRRGPATTAPPPAPGGRRRSGFPWVPFLIVLALVGGGLALSLVDDGGSSGSSSTGDSTEEPLPSITSTPPESTGSTTEQVTLEDCDPARPLGDTLPAVTDSTSSDGSTFDDGTGEEIPEFDDGLDDPDATSDPFASNGADVPSIEPTDPTGSGEVVTVDQNGNLCEETSSTDPTAPSTDAPTTQPTTSASGDWPAGRDGWTVIVAGYANDESRAQQRAADVQEDGFEDSGVLFSTDFTSLCPGFYVVYSGVFDEETEAEQRRRELATRPDYAGMYVREIRVDGAPAQGCSTASS